LRALPALAVFATLALCAGCGGSGTSSASSPSPTPQASPSPTASAGPAPLTFKLNGVKANASGTITVTAPPGQMTVRLKITGLQSNSSHISHVHIGSCQQNGNIALALNQVIADGQGEVDVKTTVKATYPPANGTWYVVVHAGPDMQGSNASYLLCGNLFA
jgi:glucose/arabinose dehydrogenase